MYRRLKGRRLSKGGVLLKNKHEIALMQEAGKLVADCFALLQASIQPGVRLRDLDRKVELLIRERGALPLYKGYQGNPPSHPPFPGVICAAVNNEVCHGLPDNRRLRKGDIVGIDIGLRNKGYCGDACVTFAVGEISPSAERLLRVSKECLYKGIRAAQPGRMIGEVGVAIEEHARRHGYSVVVEWGGHGVGKNLHEAPSVPHTGPADVGPRLRPGMVFTVEPMINMGGAENHMLKDGWTVVTNDGSLSAQFEHTIVITRKGPVILSPWHKTMKQSAQVA